MMLFPRITALDLYNFRNLEQVTLQFDKNIILFLGQNGSGKTSILEAISLLSPGRGLRSAKLDEITRSNSHWWEARFNIITRLGIAEMKSHYDADSKTKKILYNGLKIASSELTNFVNIIWLTPQMEGIFLDSPSVRRKFLDRIVYNFDAQHAERINNYDYYIKERMNFLRNNISAIKESTNWLDQIENKIASIAEEIAQKRNNIINMIQLKVNDLHQECSHLPKITIGLSDLQDHLQENCSFVEIYAQKLQQNRYKDASAHKTNFGIHKQDLIVKYTTKNLNAQFCSTGEQKAILVSISVAFILCIIKERMATPILLLDEFFVHLDSLRKKALFDVIKKYNMQLFITATDNSGIEELLAEDIQVVNLFS